MDIKHTYIHDNIAPPPYKIEYINWEGTIIRITSLTNEGR